MLVLFLFFAMYLFMAATAGSQMLSWINVWSDLV